MMFKRGLKTAPVTGPAEFLDLIRNASLVIGVSFHLIVFALLFHKEFIALNGINDARIKNILSRVSLTERGMVNENNYENLSFPSIDYVRVDKFIDDLRDESKKILLSFLN